MKTMPEVDNLVAAVAQRYPGLTAADCERVAQVLVSAVADGLREGKSPGLARINEEGGFEWQRFSLAELDDRYPCGRSEP